MARRGFGWTLVAIAVCGLVAFAWTRIPVTVWYQDRRPTRFGKATNRWMGRFASLGAPSFGMETLEVAGRKSGLPTATVLVVARYQGAEYLVSMLGKSADWVRNVNAAEGEAVLRHGRRRRVRLEEVPAADRTPVLRAYLKAAPGARPHVPLALDASDDEIAAIAADFPVFRILPRDEGAASPA